MSVKQVRKFIKAIRLTGFKFPTLRAIEILVAQAPITSWAYWKWAPDFYSWYKSRNFDEYHAPIDPTKRIYVNPKIIDYKTQRKNQLKVGRRKNFAKVSGGEWDLTDRAFDQQPIFKAAKKRFIDGIHWRDTDYYNIRLKKIQKKSSQSDSKAEEKLTEYFDGFERLFYQIKNKGYQTQDEINNSGSDYIDQLMNEILIDIGRGGNLLYVTGKHRLTIAKLLELEKVPVVCMHRHKKWMERREEVYVQNKSTPHPDMSW